MKKNPAANALPSEKSAATIPETADVSEDARKAMEALQGKDKVGQVGDLLGIATGAVAGTTVAGTAAGAAGATTLLGSSTLAGFLGGVFVTATPVGWVVSAATAGAVVAYGITKLVRSVAGQDHIRGDLLKKLKKKENFADSDPLLREKLEVSVAHAVDAGYLDNAQAERIFALVDRGALSINEALQRVQALGCAL